MSDRLSEDVARFQSRVTALRAEVGKVLVGQEDLVHRLLLGLLAGGHVLLEGVPGAREDAGDPHAGGRAGRHVLAHPVHAGHAAGRRGGHADLQPARGRLHRQEGAGVRQLHPRRRDQPRAGEGAVGAARGDAGAAGHAGRHHLLARRAVPRARDAEPDRAGGHLSAARGAARSLHAQGQGRLPDQGRGA
jgi:hypothetical protein